MITARGFPTLQAAVDALPSAGGEVVVPAGTYHLKDVLVIRKPNVTLRGDPSGASVVRADSSTGRSVAIRVEATGFRAINLHFDGLEVLD